MVFRNRRSGRRRILFGKFKGVRAFFDKVVHAPAGWRYDFENEIGSAGTAAVGQFIRITDKRDIRLNPIFIIRIQIDSERRRINAAFSAVGLDIISKKVSKSGRKFPDESGLEVPYYKLARRSALHAARRASSSNLLKYRYTYT